MNWYHETSSEWLEARRNWLTASEVAKIIPVTSTGRARKSSTCRNNAMEVWAAKQAKWMDPSSTGAAARGHIMEPYALDCATKAGIADSDISHWDDALIYNEDKGIAFSPDGMSISQSAYTGQVSIDERQLPDCAITIFEVKSYSIDRHYSKGLCPKKYIEERWQLAHAMAVSDKIQAAFLLFFNPNAEDALFVHRYSRSDLEGEIEIIDKAAVDYWSYVDDIATKLVTSYMVGEVYRCDWVDEEKIMGKHVTQSIEV